MSGMVQERSIADSSGLGSPKFFGPLCSEVVILDDFD